MRGITVSIQYATSEENEEGERVTRYSKPVAVENVLVTSPSYTDETSSRDLYGVQADRKALMPRTWDYESLKGARMSIRGATYEVLGDPQPALVDAHPTAWYVRVLLRSHHG